MFTLANDQNVREGKKTYDLSEGKKRRDDQIVSLRSRRREDALRKRREDGGAGPSVLPPVSNPTGSANTARFEQMALPPLEEVFNILQNPSLEDFLQGAVYIRRYIAHSDAAILDQVIAHNNGSILRRLMDVLQCDDHPDIQHESLWILTNVASGTTQQTFAVAPAIPSLVRLLGSPNPSVMEQAFWVLGNVSGDNVALRDEVTAAGAPQAIILGLQSGKATLSQLRLMAWLTCNLVRGGSVSQEVGLLMVAPIAALLAYDDPELLLDTVWALANLLDGAEAAIADAVVGSGTICQRVVFICGQAGETFVPHRMPCTRAIGSLMNGSHHVADVLVGSGVIPVIAKLLQELALSDDQLMKEACWTVSNLGAGTTNQINAAIDAGLITLVMGFGNHPSRDVRREVAWAVTNVCLSADLNHIRWLLNNGAIVFLCGLASQSLEKIVYIALLGLERLLHHGRSFAEVDPLGRNEVLEECERLGLVSRLEDVSDHAHRDAADVASRILTEVRILYMGILYVEFDHNVCTMSSLQNWPRADDYYQDAMLDDEDEGIDVPFGGNAFVGPQDDGAGATAAELDVDDVTFS